MTFRLRHEWTIGALVNGTQLATCQHCGTLRAENETGRSFIRRARLESERVRDVEPPCVSPALHFSAPW